MLQENAIYVFVPKNFMFNFFFSVNTGNESSPFVVLTVYLWCFRKRSEKKKKIFDILRASYKTKKLPEGCQVVWPTLKPEDCSYVQSSKYLLKY